MTNTKTDILFRRENEMNTTKVDKFYLIETVADDRQYLCKVINDKKSYRPLIHGTTRDIHSGEIMKFNNLKDAKEVCKSLEGDVHSKNPKVLSVSIEVDIREV